MADGFLSQEEIDSLLNGPSTTEEDVEDSGEGFSDLEKDLLGEIGNISMGSASTALSQILSQQVNITTPVVSITTLKKLKEQFIVPNIALEIKYVQGIVGENILIMKISDAGVIANLMMGGDGKVVVNELTEIEISAVQEAMNQMIGSAATSMSTMLSRSVNISPPTSVVWKNVDDKITDNIDESENIVIVSFHMAIGDLVDSNIMQVFPFVTAKSICKIMMGEEIELDGSTVEGAATQAAVAVSEKPAQVAPQYAAPAPQYAPEPQYAQQPQQYVQQPQYAQQPQYVQQPQYAQQPQYVQQPQYAPQPQFEVSKASFQPLNEGLNAPMPKNIDLILDVGLDISVVLGRTKKNIRDILNLGPGSLVELQKLAEEPVEVLVNGKKIAYGEVVVVDENFGVRITSIISSEDRVKTLLK